MREAFTPGPWRIDPEFDGPAIVGNVHRGPLKGETFEPVCRVFRGLNATEANARLIAASPDLHQCTELLDGLCAWLLHRFGPDSPEGREATFRQEKARAALARASAPQGGV
ncbi:hypothetical protein [Roseomonas chloroacetimidivorans]|uniref:hypothetical protein n=1 Tax=Roseomonas chloroacetimidivorans TaxID=1766656 RepID=UPI003C727679